MNLLRTDGAIFLAALEGCVQRGVSGGLAGGILHRRRHLLGRLGQAAKLRQPRHGHGERLRHVDHGRSHRAADVLGEQQAPDLLGFLDRVLDVFHQLGGLVLELSHALRDVVGRLHHFPGVHVLRGLTRVRVHEPGQNPAGILTETSDALALDQALHGAAGALCQLQVVLVGAVVLQPQHVAEQSHRLGRHAGKQLVAFLG